MSHPTCLYFKGLFLNNQARKATMKLRVFLAGHTVAMVTYCVTKIITTGSRLIGQVFDIMIVVSTDRW